MGREDLLEAHKENDAEKEGAAKPMNLNVTAETDLSLDNKLRD